MELFGAKFSIALGAWKLRFVCMLEDEEHQLITQRPMDAPVRHT